MTAHMLAQPVDMRAFNRWAADRGFVRRGTFDEGFALHVLLGSTFGRSVLQPFRLFHSPRSRRASLFAYADADASSLRRMSDTVATPDCLDVLDTKRLRSKPMRTDYARDQRLGFDVRVRPVRRQHKDSRDERGRTLRGGSEIDVFAAALARESSPDTVRPGQSTVRRENAYIRWLAERFDGAAEIRESVCRMVAFRRTRAVRGDGLGPEGPDATIHGELTIRKPDEFARRVRSGVGRHRAYGYGMLLLRPPSPVGKGAR